MTKPLPHFARLVLSAAVLSAVIFAVACDHAPNDSEPSRESTYNPHADAEPSTPGESQIDGRRYSQVRTVATLPKAFNDAVTLDSLGSLYVSIAGDFAGDNLLGTVVYRVRAATGVTAPVVGLDGPLGTVFDSLGQLYISNFNTGTIHRGAPGGTPSVFANLDGSGGGLALNQQQGLIAASYTNNAIYRVNDVGDVSVYSEDPLLAGPVGVSFAEDNTLYVGTYNDGKVLAVAPDGAVEVVADLGEAAASNIGYVTYSKGCIYATSLFANKIFSVSRDGDVIVLAGTGEQGTVDGQRHKAQFNRPHGITANHLGSRLYVSEYGSAFLRSIRLPREPCRTSVG